MRHCVLWTQFVNSKASLQTFKHAVKNKGPQKISTTVKHSAMFAPLAAGSTTRCNRQGLLPYSSHGRMRYVAHGILSSCRGKPLTFCSIGGCLASVHMAKTPDQAATTELQVLEAPKRRGVAFAFLDMSWDSHKRYLQTLFSHIRSDPLKIMPRPPCNKS